MNVDAMLRAITGLRQLAMEVNDAGCRVLMEAGVDWHSIAAEQFRDDLVERGRAVRHCAQLFEDAASALRRHLDRCARADPGWVQPR